jgi:hypothetical protein
MRAYVLIEKPPTMRSQPKKVHSQAPRYAFSEERIARPFPWQQIKRKAFEETDFLTVEKIGTCVKSKPNKLPPMTLTNFKKCLPKDSELLKPPKTEYEYSKVSKEKTPVLFRTKKRIKKREQLIMATGESKAVSIEKIDGKIILEYYDIE